MINRKNSQTKKSVPVPLFIVEGFTEKNYIDILKGIYTENVVVKNCFGGGANTVLLKSDAILSNSEEVSYYTSFVIIYDSDADSPRYDVLRRKVEAYPNTKLLILDPCFENWLLLHIRKKNIKGTMNCDKCIAALKKLIPNYEKDDFKLLQKHVTKGSFQQACSNQPVIGKVLREYFKD